MKPYGATHRNDRKHHSARSERWLRNDRPCGPAEWAARRKAIKKAERRNACAVAWWEVENV